MSLINYKDIDFKKSIDKENIIINFNDSEIRVIKYLSTNDKYDFINITLQRALEDGIIYNDFKVDMYFNLHLILVYTNIVVDEEDKMDAGTLYDSFKRSGLLDAVKKAIPAEELDYLQAMFYKVLHTRINYNQSVIGSIKDLFKQLPNNLGDILRTIQKESPEVLALINNSLQNEEKQS